MTLPIHVVPIGAPDPWAIEALVEGLREQFALVVDTCGHVIDPAPAHDVRRDQYSSRQLLQSLLETVGPPSRVLGVTEVDLFMPILTFVFGEAQLGGRAALISLHRLGQSFYGLEDVPAILHERAVKEALHELGHTYGLIHCLDYRCVMAASRVVEEIDLKDVAFCRACRARIGDSALRT